MSRAGASLILFRDLLRKGSERKQPRIRSQVQASDGNKDLKVGESSGKSIKRGQRWPRFFSFPVCPNQFQSVIPTLYLFNNFLYFLTYSRDHLTALLKGQFY